MYTVNPPLPDVSALDADVLNNLRILTRMAGKKQATCGECYDLRAGKFAQGHGRILVGWSERLAKMPPEYHSKVSIRPLPLADDNKVNLLFVDTLIVNSTLSGRRQRLALEFANLAVSADVVVDSLLVKDKDTRSPQYLLPVRRAAVRDEQRL